MEPLHRITGGTHEEVLAEIVAESAKVKARMAANPGEKFALVVTGAALLQVLKPNNKELLDDKAEAKQTGAEKHWTAAQLVKQSEVETKFSYARQSRLTIVRKQLHIVLFK